MNVMCKKIKGGINKNNTHKIGLQWKHTRIKDNKRRIYVFIKVLATGEDR